MKSNLILWPDTTKFYVRTIKIAQCDLGGLVQEFGTPLYLFDEQTICNQISTYRQGFARYGKSVKLYYACKALLNTAIAQLMMREGVGFDVVSAHEMAIVQNAGADLRLAHLHGNGTPPSELEAAVRAGIGRIIIDNLDQLNQLITITHHLNKRQKILLRVAPDVIAGGHQHIQTGSATSKFGFNAISAELLHRIDTTPTLALVGLHCHIGSQVTDLSQLATAIKRLLTIAHLHQWQLPELCVGGGLAVPTTSDQPTPTIEAYCNTIIDTVTTTCSRLSLPLPELSIEPGRSLVARAGVAIYAVTGRKIVDENTQFLHINGGMGDNPRPILYNADYQAVAVAQPLAEPTTIYQISGRYCESGDMLIRHIQLPPLQPDDLIAVPVAGAYTLSMASNYNGVGRPTVLLLRDGQAHLIQRRETWQDLIARDLPLPL